jgi:hypothetical protein
LLVVVLGRRDRPGRGSANQGGGIGPAAALGVAVVSVGIVGLLSQGWFI